jgi:hypothetical protein
MRRRLLWLAATWAIVATASLAASAGQRSFSVRLGDVHLGYFDGSGLSLWCCGHPMISQSSLCFHDGTWLPTYYNLPRDLDDIVVKSTPDGATLRIVGHPDSKAISVEHAITAKKDLTLRIDLDFQSKLDQPICLEFCALQISLVPLAGCPFQATAGNVVTRGTLPQVLQSANDIVATRLSEFSVESRLGTIRFRTDGGEPWLDVLDGRHRNWADPHNPVLWIGMLNRRHEPRVKRHLGLAVAFSHPVIEAAVPFRPAGKPAPPLPAADVVAPAPATAELPLIPAPKEVKAGSGKFTIRADTPIVVGEKAGEPDRRAAETLRRELKNTYGINARIATSAEVKSGAGAIVLGEPSLNPLAAAACRAAGVSVAAADPGPEGYVLAASPAAIVVAGCDRRGTYWGVQTLLQLLRAGPSGAATVSGVAIRDWPDFPMRIVDWSIRDKETGFQRRMIENLLARYKVNTLLLECQGIAWETHPELNPRGAKPKDVAELVRWANEHFIEVIPQIQSLGHCDDWLLQAHRELAENPQAPYDYCPSNPDTYKLLFDLYGEVEKIFHPRYFHVGHDELSPDFGTCPRCKGKSPAQLFAGDVRKLRDYWAQRSVPIILWGDMLLDAAKLPGAQGSFNGGRPLQVGDALPLLPKDVIISDWHYGDNYTEFPSLARFKSFGLRTIATPWALPGNIWNFTRAARRGGSLGVIGSTWCDVSGPERDPDCLVRSVRYLAPLVYTADCMWSVGRRPPGALPYDPGERFLAAIAPENLPRGGRSSAGFLVDLGPYGTRSLWDTPDGAGWLGYGPRQDLSALPTGRIRLAGSEFLVSPGPAGAVMLWGTYAGKAKLPQELSGIAIEKRAAELLFLNVCGWPTNPGEKVGFCRVNYADGSAEEIPLVQGKNIADPAYPLWTTVARPAWQGKMPDGTPVKAFAFAWKNPHVEREIRSLDFVSTGTRASPTLLGLSVVSP